MNTRTKQKKKTVIARAKELFAFITTTLLFTYLVSAILAFLFAEKLIFPAPQSSYKDSDRILKIPAQSGLVSAVYLSNPKAHFTILYSHGNAEDIGHALSHLENFRKRGYAIFAYDYPGYGTSTGKASEKSVNAAIHACYDYMTGPLGVSPEQIIIYGRSVGGGPSLELASKKQIAGLVLESTFTSTYRVITKIRIFPFDAFPNLKKIPLVQAPKLFIHGTEDTVIDIAHSKMLFQQASPPKTSLWVEGANHNDVLAIAGASYWETITAFTNKIQPK